MQVRGFPVDLQNTVRTFNVSTPLLYWSFPKYVELTMSMLLLFIYNHFISVLNFRFVFYFQGIYFESRCVCIFIVFLSEAV